MMFLPPDTVKQKVAALRSCLPGVNLYNFLKGMPTALSRSKETVPRGIAQLKEVRCIPTIGHRAPVSVCICHRCQVAQLPLSGYVCADALVLLLLQGHLS